MEPTLLDAIDNQKSASNHNRIVTPTAKKVFNAQEAVDSIGCPMLKAMALGYITKSINSTDLTGIRLVSFVDQIATLANMDTPFLNIIEQNGRERATDYQIRWTEEYVGNDLVVFFNLNGANPAEAQMTHGVRTNTCGSFGNTIDIRFITSELASQSPINPHDERIKQMNMRLVAMRRFLDQYLLSNVEVTAETTAFTPKWGGFINRSTLYGITPTGNLTDALIQGRIDAIANNASNNGMGYQVPLVCLTTGAQITAVRQIMISRYGGETSVAFMQTQESLSTLLPGVKLPPFQYVIYQPLGSGRPVVFIQEDLLPSGGYAVWFDPSLPKVADFYMQGVPGPWAVERYTQELTRLYVLFDFKSLVDPLIPSRSVASGLN